MFRRDKSVKLSLEHLNECFFVFKEIAKQQNITEENESQYIKVLLNSYLKSDNCIEREKIDKYKPEKTILSYDLDYIEHLQKIKDIRLDTDENKDIQKVE